MGAKDNNVSPFSTENLPLVDKTIGSGPSSGFQHPVRACLTLSIAFHLMFTATNGLLDLQSSVNDSHGLGVITMAVMYSASVLAAPFAITVVRLCGYKRLLLGAWVIRVLYVGANFYPSFITLVPTAFLVGCSTVYIGAVSFRYTFVAGQVYVAKWNLSPERHHEVLTVLYGVFFVFVEASQVTGNLMSSLVLYLHSDSRSPDDEPSVEHKECGADMCPSSNTSDDRVVPPSDATMNALTGAFLACVVISLIGTWIFLPDLHLDPPPVAMSPFQELKNCFGMLLDVRCALMVPLYMSQAMVAMLLITGFTKAYIACAMRVEWVGFIMIAYGISSTFFAAAATLLVRNMGREVLVVTFVVTDCGILLTLLLWSPEMGGTKAMLFFIAGLAGVSEGISQPQFSAFLSVVHKDKSSVGFVVLTLARSLSMALTLLISAFACMNHLLYIALTLYALGFIGYVATEVKISQGKETSLQQNGIHK